MRLTNILLRARRRNPNRNFFRNYKFLWLSNGKIRVEDTGEKEYLESKGIKVLNPMDVLTPPYETPRYEDYFPPPPPPPPPKEVCHTIGAKFSPILGKSLALMQNLCWSVVSDKLPDSVTERQRKLKKDEQRLIIESIMSAHLFDASIEELPNVLNMELPNKLEQRKKIYGLPMKRKNDLLMDYLMQNFDNTSLDMMHCLTRHCCQSPRVEVPFRYRGELVHVDLGHSMFLGGQEPLPPVCPRGETDLFVRPEYDEKTLRKIIRKQIKEEIGGPLQQPLPAIEPLQPFIGATQQQQYDELRTIYVNNSPYVHPHTVHIQQDSDIIMLDHEQMTSLTLLHLHVHTLCYALTNKLKTNAMGHLETPVVVQGLHCRNDVMQVAVYQLNTIGPHCQPLYGPSYNPADQLAGAGVRNILFYRPFDKIFKQCEYVFAKPTLKGVNFELASVMRAIHETGIKVSS